MKTKLQKNIMRRVYYSYSIRFVTEPLLWHGFMLGGCLALFGRLTHVASIYHNVMATEIRHIPEFIYKSFVHALSAGEVMTALVTLFMVLLGLSLLVRSAALLSPAPRLTVA